MDVKALIAEYEELRRAEKQLQDQSLCLDRLLTEIERHAKDRNCSHDSSREGQLGPSLKTIYDRTVRFCKECEECFRDIYLWEVAEEDFAAYLAMPGAPQIDSYSRYFEILGQIQDGVDKWDERVVRVRMPVS